MFRSTFMLRRASTATALVAGSLCGIHTLRRHQPETTSRLFALAESTAAVPIVEPPTPTAASTNKHLRLAGLGALIGFSAGYACKKIGRMFLLVLGLEFMFLQSLVALDFITVHWDNVGRRTARPLSADGQRQNESRLITMLTTNVPFKASFLGTFYLGFKSG
jgi:uncharacterized membrane protein (Fun14 family)